MPDRSIGITPYEFQYGTKPHFPNFLPPAKIELSELLESLKNSHNRIIQEASERLQKSREDNEARVDARIRNQYNFENGQLVYLKNSAAGTLDQKCLGPAEIISVQNNSTAIIKYKNKTFPIHLTKIKPHY